MSGPESDVLSVQSVEAVIPASKIKDGEAIVLPLKVTGQQVNPDKVAITPNQTKITISLKNEILKKMLLINLETSKLQTSISEFK